MKDGEDDDEKSMKSRTCPMISFPFWPFILPFAQVSHTISATTTAATTITDPLSDTINTGYIGIQVNA